MTTMILDPNEIAQRTLGENEEPDDGIIDSSDPDMAIRLGKDQRNALWRVVNGPTVDGTEY